MAEQAELEGNENEAAALTAIAHKMVAAAEKDKKEEGSPALSGKQKACIRGLLKAAERADKVFGNKIPRNCRKISNLVDDLIEECNACDLD